LELTPIELLQGIFSLIFVIITFIIAIKILLKYFERRRKELVYFSLAWIGMSSPWLPDAITFILIILTGSPLAPELYFIIGFAFIPALVFCWVKIFVDFVFTEKQKVIIILYLIISIIYEIGFWYLFFTDIEQLGVHTTPFQVDFGIFMIAYFLFIVVLAFVTGTIFSLQSLKIETPTVQLRGKLIFLAFTTFCVAVIIDSVLGAIDPIWIVVNRIVLMFSGLLFYMGFIMPEWTQKLFIK